MEMPEILYRHPAGKSNLFSEKSGYAFGAAFRRAGFIPRYGAR